MKKISDMLDKVSDIISKRKGLLPLIAIILILGNLALKISPNTYFIKEVDLLLHIGIVIAILGFLLAWAL